MGLSETEEESHSQEKLDKLISSDEFGISSSSGEQQKQAAAAAATAADSSSSQQQSSSSAPERKVSTEDPTAIIESLRARLLSERNSSKSAKQQAAQLARKVKELERQLHEEIQRRKHCEDVIQELLGKLDSAPESSEEQDQQHQSRKPKWISLRRRDSSDGSVEGDALNPSLNDQDSISPGSPSCSPISDTSAAAAARRIGRSCRTIKRKEIWELEIDEQVKGSWKKIGSDIVELCKLREQDSLGTETGWVSRVVEMFESKNEFWASSSPGADQDDPNGKSSKNKIENCGDSDSAQDDHRDPQEQDEDSTGESVTKDSLVSGAGTSIETEVGSINHADETSGEVSNASLQEAPIVATNAGSPSPDDLGTPIKNNGDDSPAAEAADVQESVVSQKPSTISASVVQEVPRSEEPSTIPAAIVQKPPKSEEPSRVPAAVIVQEPPKSEEQPRSSPAPDYQEQAPKRIDPSDQIPQNQYPADRIDRIPQYPINRFQHRHSFGSAYNSFSSSDRPDNVQEILHALRVAKQQLAATIPSFPPPIFPADHHPHLQIQPRFILEAQNPAYSLDPRFLAPNRF